MVKFSRTKKVISLVMGATLVLSLCACGNNISDTTITIPESTISLTEEEVKAYIEGKLDVSGYTYSEDSSSGYPCYSYYNSSATTDFGFDISFGGSKGGTVTLPCTYNDITEIGFTPGDSAVEEIASGDYDWVHLKNENSHSITTRISNNSGASVKADDDACEVQYIEIGEGVYGKSSVDVVGFMLSNGIGNKSTIDDVINAFGLPESINYIAIDKTGSYPDQIEIFYKSSVNSAYSMEFEFCVIESPDSAEPQMCRFSLAHTDI